VLLSIDGTTIADFIDIVAGTRSGVASPLLKSDHIFHMGGVLYGSTDL
jgi:hypothetical protein